MRKNSIKLIILTNLILITAFYAVYLARSYPFIGHDFRYFVPRLLDTYLHYRLNGPGIQWYTPTFGGGLPAYANPQHMQYSLPQLLLLAVNPWSAILISMAVFLTAGFLGAYYLSRHILHLHWTASVLGALFFTINGFYIQHLSVGHLTYIVFPIFILIIILLLDAMTPNLLAGICISLVLALTVYAGGFYVAVAYTLSTLITLPLLYLLRPRSFGWQSIFVRLALAALLTLLLTGSKIYAVTFFMRQFPRETREVFDVSMPRGIIGILSQLLGTTSLGPFFYLLTHRISEHFAGFKIQGDNAVQWLLQRIFRTYYSIWETDISMSPAVWILLVWAVVRLAKQRSIQTLRFTRGQILAGIALLASTWLTVEFVLAKGFIYPVASQMIFLRSLHTNIRYTVAFVLPLSILAAWIFHLYKKAKTRTALILFGILNVFTFVALGSYFLTPVAGYSFNISNSSRVYEGIREGDCSVANMGMIW